MNPKKHTHGFKVPKGYFDTLEARIYEQIEVEKLPKETGFKVPKGYFDSVETSVLTSVQQQEKAPKVVSLVTRSSYKYIAAVAAIFIAILSVWQFTGSSDTDFNSVESASIEAYVDEGNLNFDSYELISLFNDEEVDSLIFETNYLSEAAIEEYIFENVDDPTYLIE